MLPEPAGDAVEEVAKRRAFVVSRGARQHIDLGAGGEQSLELHNGRVQAGLARR